MIDYEPGACAIGFIWRCSGSVFPRAVLWALPSAVAVVIVLFALEDSGYAFEREVIGNIEHACAGSSPHPKSYGMCRRGCWEEAVNKRRKSLSGMKKVAVWVLGDLLPEKCCADCGKKQQTNTYINCVLPKIRQRVTFGISGDFIPKNSCELLKRRLEGTSTRG